MLEGLMNDKREQIIEKIKKLLRLAKSSNEHEAALAAARAQELLARYNLSESDFSEHEPPKEAGLASAETVKRPANWVFLLASGVAGAFDCNYFHRSDGKVFFVGVDIDHEIAAFTFGYIYRTINRLAAQFMAKSQQRRLTVKGKKKVRLSYCLGAASVVSAELRRQKEHTPITTGALVPVKAALIQNKMSQFKLDTSAMETENLSARAYWCGRRDGANIDSGRKGIKSSNPSKLLRIGL
jgi:hypothetical protein